MPFRRVLFRSDRKSTRLNSSHTIISHAVFCLKKQPWCTSHTRRPRADTTTSCHIDAAGGVVCCLAGVGRGLQSTPPVREVRPRCFFFRLGGLRLFSLLSPARPSAD